ncbi:auxin-responsive protein IAA33-like isoform X2 [Papaver somniferum]|uniref:auxin-responsive protein IAA33-like isoform X2 n=1 Tax=Papaver somniferum TaxID=3469 RepID=UPI000E6F88EF|nr:auxin-responsive protein IAA33-like isoform X2 [Papaver somniferum]
MFLSNSNMQLRIKNFHGFHSVEFDDQQIKEDETLLKVIPKVTVVLEGRSICQRISLDEHSNYHSLAKALRQMFVDAGVIGDHHLSTLVIDNNSTSKEEQLLSLSNAIPGHLIAYEDMEDDLLLAGDLNWKQGFC